MTNSSGPRPAAAHVIWQRHAHAVARSSWNLPDSERPLSDRGRAQSERLVTVLGEARPTLFVSSPAVRCVTTIEPLATAFSQTVEIDDHLAEGTDPLDAFWWIGELTLSARHGKQIVASTHGDVLLGVVEFLVPRGIGLDKVRMVKKGGSILVDYEEGLPLRARIIGPPPLD